MQFRPKPEALLVACLAILVLLGTLDAFRFLWVFPLDPVGLPLWMAIMGLDIALALLELPISENARILLWVTGLVYFTARQGVPFVGVVLVGGSAALWVGQKLQLRYLPAAGAAALLLFATGHIGALTTPGMETRLGDFRFSCHLLAAFGLFRMISWTVAVAKRGVKPSFAQTMEYFLAPAFWLSPLHAAHLLFDHMDPPERPVPRARALGWIVRGFVHAALFSVFVSLLMPRLEALFRAGVSTFRWWQWLLVGPLLFVVSYLEKSRVTYVVAGSLSLTGHDIEPDFRSPWLARNLLDYWRRFHFWLWEYYIDLIYMPLAAELSRRTGLPPGRAAFLALFLTFTVGTSLIHWVHYPAPFLTALWLGFLFGSASVAHGALAGRLANPRVGIPVTWLTVFVLYFLAYPAYGLGWGFPELVAFFRR